MNRILKIFLLILLIFSLVVFFTLKVMSPGTARPIQDEAGNLFPNSISEVRKIPIGGVDQYVIIRGVDRSKPVLLFLHGGPGSPEFPIMTDDELILEKKFIVVHWEQRGSGKSLHKNISDSSMNLDQLISDALEVSKYLQQTFKQDKIYLMGHSWGSFLGMLLIDKHPSPFHSYVGIGQVAHQYRAEKISLDWIKNEVEQMNEVNDLSELADLTFPDSLADSHTWLDYLGVQRNYVNKYGGGLTRQPINVWVDIGQTILNTKEYTITDKINFLRGNYYSMNHLWESVIQTNLFSAIDSVEVPVHIIHGIHDYQTPHIVALEFYQQLKAPKKTFHSFANSAHSPFLDEPEIFNAIILETVLEKTP
ncbi:MAG: alpha/beta hydrolase [Ekhidna sp.]